MVRRVFLSIAILCFLSIGALSAQTTNEEGAPLSETATITYSNFMREITAALPAIKMNEIALMQTSNAYKTAKSPGDIALSASGTLFSMPGAGAAAMSADTINGAGVTVGASKKILASGTSLNASFGYSGVGMYAAGASSAIANGHIPTISVSISQPLLKNFFGMADRYSLNDAKHSYEIQKAQTALNDAQTISTYSLVYFNWIAQRKMASFMTTSASNAKAKENQMRARLRVGVIENDEFQNYTAQTLQYESYALNYALALESTLARLEQYFDARAFTPSDEDWDAALLRAVSLTPSFVPFDDTASGSIMAMTKTRLEDAVKLYNNQALPNLSFSAGISAEATNAIAKDAFGDLASGKGNFSLGLTFSYPLGNNAAEANLDNAKLSLQSLTLQYTQAKQEYEKNLSVTIAQIETTKTLVENTQKRVEALQQIYSAQQRKHGQGRVELSTVLDTENQLFTEQVSLMEYQYNFINYMHAYNLLTR